MPQRFRFSCSTLSLKGTKTYRQATPIRLQQKDLNNGSFASQSHDVFRLCFLKNSLNPAFKAYTGDKEKEGVSVDLWRDLRRPEHGEDRDDLHEPLFNKKPPKSVEE